MLEGRQGKARIRRRAAGAALLLALCLSSCVENQRRVGAEMTGGGDPARGRELVLAYGCGSCHTVRGVAGAEGKVGPPLDGVGGRVYLAGRLTNTPDNMVRWISDPKSVDEKTAMPELGVTEADARDIAAYLYTTE